MQQRRDGGRSIAILRLGGKPLDDLSFAVGGVASEIDLACQAGDLGAADGRAWAGIEKIQHAVTIGDAENWGHGAAKGGFPLPHLLTEGQYARFELALVRRIGVIKEIGQVAQILRGEGIDGCISRKWAQIEAVVFWVR